MSKHKEALYEEKRSLLSYIKNRSHAAANIHPESIPPRIKEKNAEYSNSVRKEGNSLYTKRLYNTELDPKIMVNYTLSIIFAPNNSEELALGYGNRSAVLHYLNYYEDCIKDCDRAIRITTSDNLKIKLLCRKADSLTKLNRSSKKVCEEALLLLAKLKLDEKKKDDYERQLRQLLVQSISMTDDNKTCEGKKYAEELLNFERSQEIPCASKSVAIKYTKKWGRHIVATDDIEPGEIIAFEKLCLGYFSCENKYKCCGYCMKNSLMHSCIPCENCVHDVYCSESCRKEAWQKYHQFECSIYPFLIRLFKRSKQNYVGYALRFILLAIHEAGGIELMKQQLLEIDNAKDLRMKGFSDGIFQDGSTKSIFSLQYCVEDDYNMRCRFMENSCICVRLLAKHTNFFGERMNLSESEMFLKEKLLFTAALTLRFHYISIINNWGMIPDSDSEIHGLYVSAFMGLLNHSCDPNVGCHRIYFKGGYKNIYTARYPIQKGSQLFMAYDAMTFLDQKKEDRQKGLQFTCKFICDCIACKENWSSICLPSVKDIVQITPSLNIPMPSFRFNEFIKDEVLTKFTPEQHNKILHYLKLLSKNCTVHCHEYLVFLEYLDKSYFTAFWLCENFNFLRNL